MRLLGKCSSSSWSVARKVSRASSIGFATRLLMSVDDGAVGSGGARHSQRITCRMANRVNDDLALGDLVENQVRVRRHWHPADGRIICATPDVGMQQQKIGERLDAGLNPPGALW